MIVESPVLETKPIKRKVRLNKEEKDAIEKIAASLDKDPKEVQEVFLALVAYIFMNFQQGSKSFVIPYIGTTYVRTKKVVIPRGFEIQEEITTDASPAFHELITKLEFKEITWIEEFCLGILYSNLNSKLNA
jgi:hypothetical protein